MKYICKKDCYVKNPQGKFQHFKAGAVVDYPGSAEVPEHFESVNGAKAKESEKKITSRVSKKVC